jgi:hypothetical protein
MLAMKLCLERLLPRCDERPVTFSLPSLASVGNEPSPQNVSRAMNAVTTALACGEITPGEAATIAGVYETFVRTAGDVEDEDEDIGDAAAIDDSDPWMAPADGCRRDNSSRGLYSTWRRNPPANFLQKQEAESRCAIRG